MAQFYKVRHQQIADALVVAGIEFQHVPVALHGFFTFPGLPQALGQSCAGAHVRTRLQDPPEVSDILLERLFPQSPPAGFNSLTIQFNGFFDGLRRLFSKENVSVRAVGRFIQRFPDRLITGYAMPPMTSFSPGPLYFRRYPGGIRRFSLCCRNPEAILFLDVSLFSSFPQPVQLSQPLHFPPLRPSPKYLRMNSRRQPLV